MKLSIKDIKLNQSNPRIIKDDSYKKLVQSLKDFPEMLEAREIIVNKDYMILGGNMRYRAAKEAGLKEIPVKVVDWPESKQREFIIKDNVESGEWDWNLLANEWEAVCLNDWGVTVPYQNDQIVDRVNAQNEWIGLPEFESANTAHKLVVSFEDAETCSQFVDGIGLKVQTKLSNSWLTWYPYKEREDKNSLKYEA